MVHLLHCCLDAACWDLQTLPQTMWANRVSRITFGRDARDLPTCSHTTTSKSTNSSWHFATRPLSKINTFRGNPSNRLGWMPLSIATFLSNQLRDRHFKRLSIFLRYESTFTAAYACDRIPSRRISHLLSCFCTCLQSYARNNPTERRKFPSRTTLSERLTDDVFPLRKEILKDIIANSNARVTLTTDGTHASIKRMGYNVVTLVRQVQSSQ